MIRPRPLSPGDTIAILSPASIINPDLVAAAVNTIRALGYNPVVMPHALGANGSYSGSKEERLSDIRSAFTNPEIKAIFCSRGGYGAVHLLEELSRLDLASSPKWVVGFSDISAIHALMASKGIMSIHSSMAKQLAEGPSTNPTSQLFNILTGSQSFISWTRHDTVPNRPGFATGTLRGGNLAVLDALVGTPFDDLLPDNILFIEDIGEPIYKIERMLYRLQLSGTLRSLRGLVVGRFTDYKPDRNHSSMEEMIARMTSKYTYPVAFNAPIGHIGSENLPLIHGATVSIEVTAENAKLQSL